MNSDELRSKRIKYSFTQKDMAKTIGISTKSYNRKELGILEFSRKELEEISKILKLNPNEICEIFFNNLITKR